MFDQSENTTDNSGRRPTRQSGIADLPRARSRIISLSEQTAPEADALRVSKAHRNKSLLQGASMIIKKMLRGGGLDF